MQKYGFYYDMTMCMGCRACQVACKDKKNLNPGEFFRRVRSFETGEFPSPGFYHYSSTCNHCSNPACTRACPTAAMRMAADGTVQHDPSMCIKCRYCVTACPYSVPQYLSNPWRIVKCDACKDLREQGQNPVCADACPIGCLEWGPLSELRDKHAGDKPVSDIAILPSSEKTRPSVLIKAKNAAFDKDYTQKGIINE